MRWYTSSANYSQPPGKCRTVVLCTNSLSSFNTVIFEIQTYSWNRSSKDDTTFVSRLRPSNKYTAILKVKTLKMKTLQMLIHV